MQPLLREGLHAMQTGTVLMLVLLLLLHLLVMRCTSAPSFTSTTVGSWVMLKLSASSCSR